jgi:hypothetical protein
MSLLLGWAALIVAIGWAALAVLVGLACLTWSRRCDPKNPSFGPPRLPTKPTR